MELLLRYNNSMFLRRYSTLSALNPLFFIFPFFLIDEKALSAFLTYMHVDTARTYFHSFAVDISRKRRICIVE